MIYKILVLLLIIQHSVYAQDPEQLLNEANEQMSNGDLVIADSLLKESLKVDPSFAPAHSWRAADGLAAWLSLLTE